MSLTIKTFRAALPKSLRDHVTESQIEAVLGDSCIDVSSVNGCTLQKIQDAIPGLRALGVITIPCTENGSNRLLRITFLKK